MRLSSGALAAAFHGRTATNPIFLARRCAAAHFLTMGLMGGALYTWPFGVRKPLAVLPALAVLATSTTATEYWLNSATGIDHKERVRWRKGFAIAATCGFGSAVVLMTRRDRA